MSQETALVHIKARMAEFTRRQYAANSDHSLSELAGFAGVGYSIHPDLMAFLLAERAGVQQVLADELSSRGQPSPGSLLAQFVASTQDFIHQNNQFLQLTAADTACLAGLYREYMRDFQGFLVSARGPAAVSVAFEEVIERHFLALAAFVRSLGRRLGEEMITAQVVRAEYPFELQLELLGIDPDRLVEPVLDVGCGKKAALVRWLRQVGKEAFGLDQSVAPSRVTFLGGWLDFDFGAGRWGTVLSHMAFSNHFIFHHLYAHGSPASYAQSYMRILSSLKTGGSFYYTPGLPFMENSASPP